ncbi:hypothetical protein OTU49_003209 [Cherax quadricarinatus]|uniref:Uncharacterized protein n=1 Tax=Cherax quadricarinatus TaxID=27406 RepID=A0AAW0XP86_CHEQU
MMVLSARRNLKVNMLRTIFTWATCISIILPLSASQCSVTQVTCDGGICAEPCDGNLECPDGSDETKELCSSKPCSEGQTGGGIDLGDLLGDAKSSVTGKFRCAYGGCISHNFLCNGHRDCWDQSDETPDQCLSKKCNRRDFRCDYGACIKKLWSCNGYPNCLDGSDETAKACKATTCSSNKFRCKYGACIDMIKKCDGIVHCMDSSDESKELCGAQHTAVTTPGPVILTPVPVTSKPEVPPTPRPPTPRPPTPSPPTPTPSTGKPIIEGCEANKMCSCPPPNEHFCVACGSSPDVCAGIEPCVIRNCTVILLSDGTKTTLKDIIREEIEFALADLKNMIKTEVSTALQQILTERHGPGFVHYKQPATFTPDDRDGTNPVPSTPSTNIDVDPIPRIFSKRDVGGEGGNRMTSILSSLRMNGEGEILSPTIKVNEEVLGSSPPDYLPVMGLTKVERVTIKTDDHWIEAQKRLFAETVHSLLSTPLTV